MVQVISNHIWPQTQALLPRMNFESWKIIERTDSIHSLWEVIEELLNEDVFDKGFLENYKTFTNLLEDFDLSETQKIIIAQIRHCFWHLAAYKELREFNAANEEELKNMISESKNVMRFKFYIKLLKDNDLEKQINTDEIHWLLNVIKWDCCLNIKNENKKQINESINYNIFIVLIDNILSNYIRYWDNWVLTISFHKKDWEIKISNNIKKQNKDGKVWTWMWLLIMKELVKNVFSWEFISKKDEETYTLETTKLSYK